MVYFSRFPGSDMGTVSLAKTSFLFLFPSGVILFHIRVAGQSPIPLCFFCAWHGQS